MKKIVYSTFSILLLAACTGKTASDNPTIAENDTTIQETASTNQTETTPTPTATSTKEYQEYYETGQLKIEGDFDENQARNGLWVSYYETGIKWSESMYRHGSRNGHSIAFFPNGKVRFIGEYKDDVKIGTWEFYDENGDLVKEETY